MHTLNARGNLLLPVIREQFNMDSSSMFNEISGLLQQCSGILEKKGIIYNNLRKSLTPQQDRKEISLVFDSGLVNGSWYGRKVMDKILSLLDKSSSSSVLAGDFTDNSYHGRKILSEAIDRNLEDYSDRYFIVYINNLTNAMVRSIDNELKNYNPYLKYVDTTYGSIFKIYLSTMLCHAFIQYRNVIIQGHEDDRSNDEDVNMIGYNFEDHGFTCKSIQGMIQSLFLSYKIESPVFEGFEEDIEFSLNYAHKDFRLLKNLFIFITEDKFNYLKREKGNSLKMAGIDNIDEFKRIILEKINSNYIYNISFNQYEEIIFNIVIEMNNFRMNIGLKHKIGSDSASVITAF